jgi:hypothetical protein
MPITRNRFRAAALGVPVLAAVAIAGCGGATTAKTAAPAPVKAAIASQPIRRATSHPARPHPRHVHRPSAAVSAAPKPAATTPPAPAPVQSSPPAPTPGAMVSQSPSAPARTTPTPATAPASPPPTTAGIPQHNGGDMDGDNNGGPSDGDGGV